MVTRLSDGCQLGSMLRTDLDSNARFGFLGSIDVRHANACCEVDDRRVRMSVKQKAVRCSGPCEIRGDYASAKEHMA